MVRGARFSSESLIGSSAPGGVPGAVALRGIAGYGELPEFYRGWVEGCAIQFEEFGTRNCEGFTCGNFICVIGKPGGGDSFINLHFYVRPVEVVFVSD